MKKLVTFVMVAALGLLAACAKPADAAGNEGAGDQGGAAKNLLEQSVEAAKQLAAVKGLQSTFDSLKATLAGITDGATAEQAKGTLEQLVGKLKDGVAQLDLGKLPGEAVKLKDSLVQAAMPLVQKLIGNPEVQQAIGPMLVQLKGVLGG